MKNNEKVILAVVIIIIIIGAGWYALSPKKSPTTDTSVNSASSSEAILNPEKTPMLVVAKVVKIDGQQIFYKTMGMESKEGSITVLPDTEIVRSNKDKTITKVSGDLSSIKPSQIIEIIFNPEGTQVKQILILE